MLFSGGRVIPTIVLNVEPVGTRRLPTLNTLDLRGAKTFTFGKQKMEFRVNVFNVLNINKATGLNMRSGPNFMLPTGIVLPRVLDFSVLYTYLRPEVGMTTGDEHQLNRRQLLALLGGATALAAIGRSAEVMAGAQSVPPGLPPGAVIRTILKDLPPQSLSGSILFHEHLDGVYSRDTRQLELPPPSSADIAPVVADVKQAAAGGVVCIVDGGHPDMGVNYEHLREISRQTGVHVVASGGYYLQNTYPAEVSQMSEDQLTDSLVKEAAAGRYGAFGEIGDMPGETDFTADERKVFRAVGKAHLRNGLPIFTHNNYGTGPDVPREIALRQLDVYEGVASIRSASQSAIWARCRAAIRDIMKALGKRGAFVGIDRHPRRSRG